MYETQGRDTRVRVAFDRPVKAEEVDILERPFHRSAVTVVWRTVTVSVGHDQIVTLKFSFAAR